MGMASEQIHKLCERLRVEPRRDIDGNKSTAVLQQDNHRIARFATSLHSNHPRSVSLNLSNLTTQTEGLDSLLIYVQSSPTLVDVRLAGSDCRNSASAHTVIVQKFLVAISRNTSIEGVALSNLRLDASALAKVLSCNLIISISLDSCSVYSQGNAIETLAKAGFGKNTSLEKLHLVGLEERLLLPILKQVRNLHTLDVSYGSIEAAGCISKVIANSPRLVSLTLRDSSLLYVEPIVRKLQRSTVQRFEIVNCDMDVYNCSLLSCLFRYKETKIKYLNLCNVDFEDDSNLEALLQGLVHSESLTRFRLHHVQNLQARDYEALIQFLQDSKHLTRIDLDRTILSTLGCDTSKSTSSSKSNGSVAKFLFSRRKPVMKQPPHRHATRSL